MKKKIDSFTKACREYYKINKKYWKRVNELLKDDDKKEEKNEK